MKKIQLTDTEQKELRINAKNELLYMENILNNEETTQLVDSFKNKYNVCETVYKIILSKHQECLHKQNNGFLKVDMRQVPHALAFAGYTFDKSLLSKLFGASTIPNERSVKKLRDAVTHGLESKAVEEIKNRKDELFGYMNSFLEFIKSFDDQAA